MIRRCGFTLIEVLISVVMFGVFVVVLIWATTRLLANPETDAEARAWASKMGLEVLNVACVNTDTDGDGYVSCTIAAKRPGIIGPAQLTHIECTTKWSLNEGCKMQKVGNTR